MLHLAKQNIKQNGAVISTLGNRKFDIVIANMVFQDIYNLEDVLKMLKKHLNKNGVIIASFPNPLHSSEKGNSPTARHQFLNEGNNSGILIEKMYWSDDEESWTYKYHRSFELYNNSFNNAGFEISELFYPEPIEEGKCNLQLYEYNKTTQNTIVVLMRRN